ncbi:putative YigZ family protein [Hallella bergensis DSM 17361]|uniref:Putative YigZ family protein n=1 Tax=Hallella bergensis DSM 17361 TaxID=585502 RepID=D1PUJ0_9BACT|nr:YigZ family protein [Hallella bergensis]EFA44950.1 putative YigZ family protein [Hallella bergensis DSM 17361]
MNDSYKTIQGTGEGYYTEKRSKFLAFAHHVESAEEVKKIVDGYRKKYYDARHCCYAYMLGADRSAYRANDDGEPSSTAGKPILGQINSKELTNILICVIRYYGGVNLGTGGLIVAYRTAAADAIAHCEIVERLVEEEVTFSFSYPMMNGVMRVVKDMDARIVAQKFELSCEVVLSIRKSLAGELRARLKQLNFG